MKLSLLALFFFISLVSASDRYKNYGRSRNHFPNPMENPMLCGRDSWKKTYVCDPDKILGTQDTEASQLDELINRIINETKCPCSAYSCKQNKEGFKVAVAIVKKMADNGDNNIDFDDDDDEGQSESNVQSIQRNLHLAQQFALDIQKQWKFGRCEDDVVIFYSHEDNVVYTVTGDVARQKLTNEIVASIALDAKKSGFNKTPFDGLWTIVNKYRVVLLGGKIKTGESKQSQNMASYLQSGALLFTLASCLLAALLSL